MARQSIIPKSLSNCQIPFCSACSYAKLTKRPWKPCTSYDYKQSLMVMQPGQLVSKDMLISPTLGLIAQMSGFITKQRYHYATVYVDQATGYAYVYLQQTASAQETLESKKAFERAAATHNISIKAYHADNGIFKANNEYMHVLQHKAIN